MMITSPVAQGQIRGLVRLGRLFGGATVGSGS
jgi:hypothetical protein